MARDHKLRRLMPAIQGPCIKLLHRFTEIRRFFRNARIRSFPRFLAGVQSALESTWLRNFVSKAEALMNVHVSYRLPKLPAVEKDVQHQIEKLQKRLQVFRPELVHLKGVVEEMSAREGTSVVAESALAFRTDGRSDQGTHRLRRP